MPPFRFLPLALVPLMLFSACGQDDFSSGEGETEGDGDTSSGGGNGDGDGDATGGTGAGGGDGDTGGTGDGDGDGDGDATGGMGGDPNSPCYMCEGETPFCNEDRTACVECRNDGHCEDGVCDENGSCVECLEAAHCADPSLPMCDSNECTTGCAENADCQRFADTPVCEPVSGTCVPCTATDYASCGTDPDSGDAYVCDALSGTCSTTETEAGASLCQPCVSSANCQTGQACVMQAFEDTEVGYFCFTKPGADGNPLSCDRPYSDLINAAETIDKATTDICGLRQTTCPALSDFSSPDVDCRPDGMTADDSLCGVEGLADGYCRIFQDFTGEENDVYRCTVECASTDDCLNNWGCIDSGVTSPSKVCALAP